MGKNRNIILINLKKLKVVFRLVMILINLIIDERMKE